MAFGRIRGDNQFIFLNTGYLFGVQSYSVTPVFGNSPLKYMGMGDRNLNQIPDSAQYTDLTMSSLLIDREIILQQTGLNPINCFILKNQTEIDSAYSLISGCLSNYSSKYSPNQVPQINSTFRFFNNAGNISIPNLESYSASQLSGIASNVYPSFDGYVADSNRIVLTSEE